MSYGRLPRTKEGQHLLEKSIYKPVKNGTIINDFGYDMSRDPNPYPIGTVFEVLYDTVQHGNTMVQPLKWSDEKQSYEKLGSPRNILLYLHYKDLDYLKSQEEGM